MEKHAQFDKNCGNYPISADTGIISRSIGKQKSDILYKNCSLKQGLNMQNIPVNTQHLITHIRWCSFPVSPPPQHTHIHNNLKIKHSLHQLLIRHYRKDMLLGCHVFGQQRLHICGVCTCFLGCCAINNLDCTYFTCTKKYRKPCSFVYVYKNRSFWELLSNLHYTCSS